MLARAGEYPYLLRLTIENIDSTERVQRDIPHVSEQDDWIGRILRPYACHLDSPPGFARTPHPLGSVTDDDRAGFEGVDPHPSAVYAITATPSSCEIGNYKPHVPHSKPGTESIC